MGNDLEFHLVNHDPKIAILLEIPCFQNQRKLTNKGNMQSFELATGFSTIPNVPGFLGSHGFSETPKSLV
jgi:hypothetical protein